MFEKGNQFWKQRSTHGRKPIFADSEQLWEACTEYFDWIDENPLCEEKAFHCSGKITTCQVPKMRAMTIEGLCLFLSIGYQTWADYRKKPDFSEVCKKVERVIYTQKFTGAAANLLNASIIVRELGLKDKQEIEKNNRHNINLKPASKMTLKELEEAIMQASHEFADEIGDGRPRNFDDYTDEELRAIIRAGEDRQTPDDIREQIKELTELLKIAEQKGSVTV